MVRFQIEEMNIMMTLTPLNMKGCMVVISMMIANLS